MTSCPHLVNFQGTTFEVATIEVRWPIISSCNVHPSPQIASTLVKQECLSLEGPPPHANDILTLKWLWFWDNLEHRQVKPSSTIVQVALELDPMTLVFELDLNMFKMHHYTKVRFLCKLIQKTDTPTLQKHYLPAYVGGKDHWFIDLISASKIS